MTSEKNMAKNREQPGYKSIQTKEDVTPIKTGGRYTDEQATDIEKLKKEIERYTTALKRYDIDENGYESIDPSDKVKRTVFDQDIKDMKTLRLEINNFSKDAEQILIGIYGERAERSTLGRDVLQLYSSARFRMLAMSTIYRHLWPFTGDEFQ